MSERRLKNEWTAAAFDRDKGEWVHTTNQSYEHSPEINPEMFVRQAPPIRVTPSKRKRLVNEGQWHTVFGDTHHPFQDERKLNLAHLLLEELHPVSHTFIGDDTDMAMLSRFETRQEWMGSTQEGIDQFAERMAKVRATLGSNAVINAVQGNHDIRLEKQIRQYNGELLGLRRANAANELGVLTMEFLLRCEELGVDYISGYPEAEVWLTDDTKAYHGRKTSSTGSVVAQELKQETSSFVHGHGHSNELLFRTFRNGRDTKTIWGAQVGAFADPNKIPSGAYSRTERGNQVRQVHNWQAGALAIHEGIDGTTTPIIFTIGEDINIFGKVYKS